MGKLLEIPEDKRASLMEALEPRLKKEYKGKVTNILGLVADNLVAWAHMSEKNETWENALKIAKENFGHINHILCGPIDTWREFPETMTPERQQFTNPNHSYRFDWLIVALQ